MLSCHECSAVKPSVNVFNYANRNQVNGEPRVANLSAVALHPGTNPSQLLVGPKFIPRLFWGPYWVVAAGPGSIS